MDAPSITKGFEIAYSFARLDPLEADQCFIAVGPDARGFYANPDGCATTDNGVPDQVLKDDSERDHKPGAALRLTSGDTLCRFQPLDESLQSLVDERVQHLPKPELTKAATKWAVSKRSGRPHSSDTWELLLKEGERVAVLQDKGRDWYLVQNRGGVRGWAHKSWLDVNDPTTAFARFSEDLTKLLVPGELRNFPDLTKYMNYCARDGCKQAKRGALGICAHDLHRLLFGSGRYSVDFVKQERNIWHPDKFARFCHLRNRAELKAKAEQMFVLFGVLLDWLVESRNDTQNVGRAR